MNIVSQSIHASLCQNSPYLGPKLDLIGFLKKNKVPICTEDF